MNSPVDEFDIAYRDLEHARTRKTTGWSDCEGRAAHKGRMVPNLQNVNPDSGPICRNVEIGTYWAMDWPSSVG